MTGKKQEYEFDPEELDEIHGWVDGFRLSREKKNIRRDFSDGILIGEIVSSVDPSLVDLKQLVESLNAKTKVGNWNTLNSRHVSSGMTFSKMGFRFSDEDVDGVVNSKPLAIEHVLRILKVKIEMYIKQRHEKKGYGINQKNIGQQESARPANLAQQVPAQSELPMIKKKVQSQSAKHRMGRFGVTEARRVRRAWGTSHLFLDKGREGRQD